MVKTHISQLLDTQVIPESCSLYASPTVLVKKKDGGLWVQHCERCQQVKEVAPVAWSYMAHLLTSRPNEIMALDFTVLEPSHSGHENVLVMTDVFSKFKVNLNLL